MINIDYNVITNNIEDVTYNVESNVPFKSPNDVTDKFISLRRKGLIKNKLTQTIS